MSPTKDDKSANKTVGKVDLLPMLKGLAQAKAAQSDSTSGKDAMRQKSMTPSEHAFVDQNSETKAPELTDRADPLGGYSKTMAGVDDGKQYDGDGDEMPADDADSMRKLDRIRHRAALAQEEQ